VTTNYDKLISPRSVKSEEKEDLWRLTDPKEFNTAFMDKGNKVFHLHGCIDDQEKMIITMQDYLRHYSETKIKNFLNTLFTKKTVLFLGYGFGETEILEYVLKKKKKRKINQK
jgi:hypothetical protein